MSFLWVQGPSGKPGAGASPGWVDFAGTSGKLYAAYNSATVLGLQKYDPALGTWSSMSNPSMTASGAMVTLAGGDIMVFGGSGTPPLSTVKRYSPASNTWTTKASLPGARQQSVACRFDLAGTEKVLVVGGGDGSGTYGNAWVYTPSTDTWSVLASLPHVGNNGLFSVVWSSSTTYPIVLVSGVANAYAYNGSAWVATAIPAPQASQQNVVAVNNYIFYPGSASYYRYNISNGTTTDLLPPLYRSQIAACRRTGTNNVIVAGGFSGSYRQEVYEVDITTGSWSSLPSLTAAPNLGAATRVMVANASNTAVYLLAFTADVSNDLFQIYGDLTPTITSPTTASGTQGSAFSYTITATNTPTSYGATGLPAGLSVNTGTGVISGTPSVSGTFSVTVTATNAFGTGSNPLTITLAAQPAPVINSSLAASGTQGSAFSYSITASNSPTSYGASGLPSGLSINTGTGAITGTPSVSGTFNVTISATNAGGTGSATLVVTLASGIPVITSSLAASGTQGVAFSYAITATRSPTSYGATGLPAGLSINTGTGAITGTPSVNGSFNVSISATNAYGTGSATLGVTLASGIPVITSSLSASGTQGSAFSYSITASNSPTSYGASGLPSGLSINTGTGAITGTPSVSGTVNVTISATNATGTGSATLVLTLASGVPVITSSLTASGSTGFAFSYAITATKSPTSYGATGLPAGLSINTGTGAITGTPTVPGVSNVSISATNTYGTDTQTLVVTLTSITPVITSPLSASGTQGQSFNYQISATNSPTSFNATGLPAGLSVNTSSGVISGTPSGYGVSNVSITATNGSGSDTQTLNIAITQAAPVISSPSTSTGAEGTAYSYSITASNTPTSFSATGLPTGLTVNTSTGQITGTPTAVGVFPVSISATNSGGSDTDTLTLTVVAAPVINSALVSTATVGVPYSYTITATNSPTSFTATGLPAGLSVNAGTGEISGTPVSAGVSSIQMSATNAAGGVGHATLVLTVLVAPPVVTSSLLKTGMQNVPVSYTITATESPTSFGASNLPVGLSLNTATGEITGTPSSYGSVNSLISATNAGGTDTQTLVFELAQYVPPPPVITSPLSVSTDRGRPFTYTIEATNNATDFTATGLPAGLTFSEFSATIQGTPTVAAVTDITITAGNSGGVDTKILQLDVSVPPPRTVFGQGTVVSRRAVVWGYGYRIRNGQALPVDVSASQPLDESKSGQVYPVNTPRSVFGGP